MTHPPSYGVRRRPALRLGLQTGLLVVGVLVVVGLLIWLLAARSADDDATDTLRETTARIDAPGEAPPGVSVVVVTPTGRSASERLPRGFPDERALAAVARDGRTRQEDRRVGGRDYAVRTARSGDRVVQAVLDRHELEEEQGRILTALLVAGGVGVLLAALVAMWLARRAMDPLTQSLSLQRRFVADASHELRTPLTLLSTRLQLAARRARHRDGSVPVEDLDGVLADTRRLTEILEDLLIAADTGAQQDAAPLDLGALARECVEAAAAEAVERAVELRLDVAGPAPLHGVEPALRRAVTALVDNALDHAHRVAEVRVDRRGRTVVLAVLDDGPGIPEADRRRVFERFTSARSDGDGGDGGDRRHYGIGLALVADVAEAHGGTVTAGPRPDRSRGAALTLTLRADSS